MEGRVCSSEFKLRDAGTESSLLDTSALPGGGLDGIMEGAGRFRKLGGRKLRGEV